MPLLDEVNSDIHPYCLAVNNGYRPVEYDAMGARHGITGFFSDGRDEAFALNAPMAGWVRDVTLEPGLNIAEQPVGDRFILRAVVGYGLMVTYLNDRNTWLMRMICLINAMTGAAYKIYGPRITRLTYERPGFFNNDYLRELENDAGYELRLYGELTPALVLERETVE